MSVPEHDVRMAYRLILGREPETDAVVKDVAGQVDSLEQLRAAFLVSAEFRSTLQALLPLSVEEPSSPQQIG